MKKFLIAILTFFVLLSPTFAQNVEFNDEDIKITETAEISTKLKKEIKEVIIDIYGKEFAEEVFTNVLTKAQNAIDKRAKELLVQDYERNPNWYKNEIIYMFYVDQFGVISDKDKNTFNDTVLMLDYLEDLGVTTLYMLPFADSPMKDAGFDVKDPQNIRKELGGLVEFNTFVKAAKKRGFKIKVDLVLNHFSDSHEWFQNLIKGDENYLEYFIYRESMPEYKRYQDEKLGTVIEYQEEGGVISKRRIIFPENCETNWRKVIVNNKDYYLYHTFYPFQLDINWQNPKYY